jgi:hypothetical protein
VTQVSPLHFERIGGIHVDKKVSTAEAKAHLSALIAEVACDGIDDIVEAIYAQRDRDGARPVEIPE